MNDSFYLMTHLTTRSWGRVKGIIKDIDNEVCQYCGQTAPDGVPDHILPLRRGGSDSIHNLVWSCNECNTSKGQKTVREWVQSLHIQARKETIEVVNDNFDDKYKKIKNHQEELVSLLRGITTTEEISEARAQHANLAIETAMQAQTWLDLFDHTMLQQLDSYLTLSSLGILDYLIKWFFGGLLLTDKIYTVLNRLPSSLSGERKIVLCIFLNTMQRCVVGILLGKTPLETQSMTDKEVIKIADLITEEKSIPQFLGDDYTGHFQHPLFEFIMKDEGD